MKHKKFYSLICAYFVLLSCCFVFAFNASAATEPPKTSTIVDDDARAAGLISAYSLVITSSTKKVKITAEVDGYETMAKIGFTNIEVQRSTNGSSGWVTELTPIDDTVTNAVSHTKNNEARSVVGGYYYRVKLDHYAKETGCFFPSSQSITDYSNVVWVPKS